MLPFICGSSETCRTLANPKALDLSLQRYDMHCSSNWLKDKNGLRTQAAPRLHSSECSWEVGDGAGGSGVSPTFIFQGVGWTQEKLQKDPTTTFRAWSISRPKFLSTSTPTIKVKQSLPQKRFTPFNLQVNTRILISKNPVLIFRYFQYWKLLWSLSRYYIPQHWQGKFSSDRKCLILMSLLLFLPCWIIQFCNVRDNLLPYRLREQKKACMDGKGWKRMTQVSRFKPTMSDFNCN